jgi:hypothetical protein
LSIPEKIVLPYLNSDAFRICVEEAVFQEQDINTFLTNKKTLFETRISQVLNGLKIQGKTDNQVFTNSLDWDGDISNMDGLTPVIISSYADNIYPIGLNLSVWPPELYISNQTFSLYSLVNQSVTYRVLLPKGISVQATDTLGKLILNGTLDDGREYIEVSFDSTDRIISDILLLELSASPFFMIGIFMPCILSLVLVIILIVIVYLIRKRRKGKKIASEEPEVTGYEEQDYYVPPPPGSK